MHLSDCSMSDALAGVAGSTTTDYIHAAKRKEHGTRFNHS